MQEAIKMEPYNAVFGVLPRCGLNTDIPSEFLRDVLKSGVIEEQLKELLSKLSSMKCFSRVNIN